MTARTTLLRGRAFAQSLMVDACVIEHPVPPIDRKSTRLNSSH